MTSAGLFSAISGASSADVHPIAPAHEGDVVELPFIVETFARVDETLARDAWVGLTAPRKWLPPKYLYDERGATLYELICETPEYYAARLEQAILEGIADELVTDVSPDEIVELGSGPARSTRILIRAALATRGAVRYLPLDVSKDMLRASATRLLADHPGLSVRGRIADFTRVGALPARGGRRLVAMLGGTIGNLDDHEARLVLGAIGAGLGDGDRLLVGFDLMKPIDVTQAAYDDANGVTAAFNLNALHMLNRTLGATFDETRFAHEARWNPARSRVEMHLRARETHDVRIAAFELDVPFEDGETVLTRSTRQWAPGEVDGLVRAAGLRLERWEASPGGWFALALCARA